MPGHLLAKQETLLWSPLGCTVGNSKPQSLMQFNTLKIKLHYFMQTNQQKEEEKKEESKAMIDFFFFFFGSLQMLFGSAFAHQVKCSRQDFAVVSLGPGCFMKLNS